jgi:uncharacterized protein (DUF4415 family)
MSDKKREDRKAATPPVDNPEWTDEDFARAKPASEVLGKEAATLLVRKRGRPAKLPEERKKQLTLRLSPDLRTAMRSSGAGWMNRAEKALRREFLKRA